MTLTLSGLTAGQSVEATFDLLILDSWDGRAGNNQGNDTFIFAMDSNVMLDTTFSNVNGSNQDYPNARGLGNFAPQTGALNVDKNHGGTLDNGYYSN